MRRTRTGSQSFVLWWQIQAPLKRQHVKSRSHVNSRKKLDFQCLSVNEHQNGNESFQFSCKRGLVVQFRQRWRRDLREGKQRRTRCSRRAPLTWLHLKSTKMTLKRIKNVRNQIVTVIFLFPSQRSTERKKSKCHKLRISGTLKVKKKQKKV